jgi:hypothetical protein
MATNRNECPEKPGVKCPPILMGETMISVEVNTRTLMGQENLFGHKHFHARCVPDVIAEYEKAEASFKKR